MNRIAPTLVTALPGAAAAAVAWRARGQLHVTVIAKATFAFAPEAEMPRAAPQPVLTGEVYHGGDAPRTVRFTSDLAPYLGRADVVLTGYAHAPPGAAVQSVPVRVTIFDGSRIVLDKALLVQDRAPFQRMPVVYERAARGADGVENPFGVARGAPEGPNVVDPSDPERPAGFGPIARAWPARRRRLGSTPRAALEGRIQEIPDGFDWSYFQSAPPDQQIDFLRGGEWLVLQGLHPAVPQLRTRLPEARGLARIHGLSAFGVPEGQPLELVADTLRIDGEEQRCTVVFRQSFPVAGEDALAAARILAGVELPGAPIVWPARAEPQAMAGAAGVASVVGPGSGGSAVDTVALPDDARVAATSAVPFRPGVAAAPVAAAGTPGPRVDTGTLVLGAEEALGAEPATLVRLPAPSAPAPLPEQTLTLSPSEDAAAAGPSTLPFQAPAPDAAPPAPPPARVYAVPPEPPPEPPPAPRVPTAAPAAPAAPVPPTPSAALKKSLYGRFSRK